jgi:hypothetical protein
MQARIRGLAGADPPQRRPEPWIALGPGALEDPAPELGAPLGGDTLETRGELEQLERYRRLEALRSLEIDVAGRDERIDEIADPGLRVVFQAAGNAPECDEELLPGPSSNSGARIETRWGSRGCPNPGLRQ